MTATALTGVQTVVEALERGPVVIELIDFRDFVSRKDETAKVEGRTQAGDLWGYTELGLGRHSGFEEVRRSRTAFRARQRIARGGSGRRKTLERRDISGISHPRARASAEAISS